MDSPKQGIADVTQFMSDLSNVQGLSHQEAQVEVTHRPNFKQIDTFNQELTRLRKDQLNCCLEYWRYNLIGFVSRKISQNKR